MKKKLLIVASFFIFICLTACAGYKPIYSSSNVHFTIADYSIKGDKKLGNQIYSKLLNISRYNKDNPTAQSIKIVGEAISLPGGNEALKMRIIDQYIEQLDEVLESGSVSLFPANLASLKGILEELRGNKSTTKGYTNDDR